jgi:hypothetical protein
MPKDQEKNTVVTIHRSSSPDRRGNVSQPNGAPQRVKIKTSDSKKLESFNTGRQKRSSSPAPARGHSK